MGASSEPASLDASRRRGPGRPFAPGVSGNPTGLPKDLSLAVIEARRLALSYAPRAIERLGELLDSEDPRVVAVAATALLDRGGVRPHTADLPVEAAPPPADVEDLRRRLAERVAGLASSEAHVAGMYPPPEPPHDAREVSAPQPGERP